MQNTVGGTANEALKWDRNQLAPLGAYLIHLEFIKYKKFKFDTVDLGQGNLFYSMPILINKTF